MNNYPVNKADFRLFANVNNEIDFLIKNVDRNPQSYANVVATVNIVDQQYNRLLMSRNLQVVDDSIGLSRLTVTGTEAAGFPQRPLTYSVTFTNTISNSTSMLYLDQGYKTKGTIFMEPGPTPAAVTQTTLTMEDLLMRSCKYYTQTYEGPGMVESPTNILHCSAQFSNFTGTITVQGSNEFIASDVDDGWSDVSVQTFVNQSTQFAWTVSGSWNWVRFVVNLDPSNQGQINQILFYND